jgi:hypothetical protein
VNYIHYITSYDIVQHPFEIFYIIYNPPKNIMHRHSASACIAFRSLRYRYGYDRYNIFRIVFQKKIWYNDKRKKESQNQEN